MTHTCLCKRCDLFIFEKKTGLLSPVDGRDCSPVCCHVIFFFFFWRGVLFELLPVLKNVRLRKYTGTKLADQNTRAQWWEVIKKKETSICSEHEDSRRGGMEQREKICKKCVTQLAPPRNKQTWCCYGNNEQ